MCPDCGSTYVVGNPVQQAAQAYREARPNLERAVREAKQAGATIPQLMAWTGFKSERSIWDLLGSPRTKEEK